MKRIKVLMMTALLFGGLTCANAQEYKHEISLGYGGVTITDIGDVISDGVLIAVTGGLYSYIYGDKSHMGAISLNYFYGVNKIVKLGGVLSYSRITRDILSDKKPVGEGTNSYYTIMPAAKFNWYDSKGFTFYSKVAAGLSIESRTDKEGSNSKSDSGTLFNFQVSPIGLEVGANSVRAFAEIGFGQEGVAQIGVRTRF